jgi:prepilin-type N-terminal cleavage/methylation domain-containing protein
MNKTNNKQLTANSKDSYIRKALRSLWQSTRKNSHFEAPVASGEDSYIRKKFVFRSIQAFTLIELIIVIAIIAILAAAIFVALDPARRLHESRNARRWSDVTGILEALTKYQTDNNGDHYSVVSGLNTGTFYVIGTDGGGACGSDCGAKSTDNDCKDLSELPDSYMGTIPYDPKSGSLGNTDYYISRTTNNRLIVGACDSEGTGTGGTGTDPTIELTR